MIKNDFCIDCLRYNGGCDFSLKPINNKGKIDCFLREEKYDKKDYYKYDISNFIKEYKNQYSSDFPNNIFFTTASLRDYHYLKQKNNAYYHIQAINLPFQNVEFYYIDKELKKWNRILAISLKRNYKKYR